MRKTISMVFAGGRGEDLSVLTERRPKAAVIFGGIYRSIDFVLTNLANAGIGQVGILAQPASPSSTAKDDSRAGLGLGSMRMRERLVGTGWQRLGSDRRRVRRKPHPGRACDFFRHETGGREGKALSPRDVVAEPKLTFYGALKFGSEDRVVTAAVVPPSLAEGVDAHNLDGSACSLCGISERDIRMSGKPCDSALSRTLTDQPP